MINRQEGEKELEKTENFGCHVCDVSKTFSFFTVSQVCNLLLKTLGPFIRGKIRRVLNKTQTFRINGTFRLK